MTLEESITNFEEVLKRHEKYSKTLSLGDSFDQEDAIFEDMIIEEYRQIIEWLKDYKQIKEQDPVNTFLQYAKEHNIDVTTIYDCRNPDTYEKIFGKLTYGVKDGWERVELPEDCMSQEFFNLIKNTSRDVSDIDVGELEQVRKELLERGDEAVTFQQLVERFDEVEEEYKGKPWNLKQIYNNFNILIGEKNENL